MQTNGMLDRTVQIAIILSKENKGCFLMINIFVICVALLGSHMEIKKLWIRWKTVVLYLKYEEDTETRMMAVVSINRGMHSMSNMPETIFMVSSSPYIEIAKRQKNIFFNNLF